VTSPSFPPTSRYALIPTATTTDARGRVIVHLQRRFCPQPERFELLTEHEVQQGDRLDNLAYRYLDDPEQFWRMCDANRAVRPDELTETPGRRLRITLPEGIPGPADA
jgi:hypothetical protein